MNFSEFSCLQNRENLISELKTSEKIWNVSQKRCSSQQPFTIVVVGQQNSGKSTLCNSLIEDWENSHFLTGDYRVTESFQEEMNPSGTIRVIDTPGFGTTTEEDAIRAREQWAEADAVLFVHGLFSGELDKTECSELQAIAKYHNRASSRVLVICSQYSGENLDQVETIFQTVKEQVRSYIGEDFSVIRLDSIDYQVGHIEEDTDLVADSGMLAALEWLESCRRRGSENIEKDFAVDTKRFLSALTEARSLAEKNLESIKSCCSEQKSNMFSKLKDIFDGFYVAWKRRKEYN